MPVRRRRVPDAARLVGLRSAVEGAHSSLVPVEVVGLGAGLVPELPPRPAGSRAAARRCGVSRGAGAEHDRDPRAAHRSSRRRRAVRVPDGSPSEVATAVVAPPAERQDREGDATGATGPAGAGSSGAGRCSEAGRLGKVLGHDRLLGSGPLGQRGVDLDHQGARKRPETPTKSERKSVGRHRTSPR